jgi:hypothetical protein
LFFLFNAFPVFSQESEANYDEEQKNSWDFLLIPLLETVFSGNVQWRPDWPFYIPPDSFMVSSENRLPVLVELFNDSENFTVRRDTEGRLLEFPFFLADKYASVRIVYSNRGILQRMEILLKNYSSSASDMQSEETAMNIYFPADFFPYSGLSPGGAFPVIRVSSDDSEYYVYIFETPSFLTETWYDAAGNMILHSKTDTEVINGAWRIVLKQIYDVSGIRFVDYFHDSGGNITEVRSIDVVSSAVFRENRLTLWQFDGFISELQWDTQGILKNIKTWDENGLFSVEYRYDHEKDTRGNWIRRRETAFMRQYDLMVPQVSYSASFFNRRIIY